MEEGICRKEPIRSGRDDPREVIIDKTTAFLEQVETTNVKVGFGEGISDISSFETYLNENQNMPLEKFVKLHDPAHKRKYLEKLGFDPLSATYFDMFMDASKRPANEHYEPDNYSLSPEQKEVFKNKGFVVTSSEDSFTKAYYQVYNNDLPVLVTTDSILHAYHKNYDSVLQDVEGWFGVRSLLYTFVGMRNELLSAFPKFASGPFESSLKDVDVFLAVAVNLLINENGKHPVKTVLGNGDDVVTSILEKCEAKQRAEIDLFGKSRVIDFSLFVPRGHYTKRKDLRQYFRTFTWLSTIDMIVAGEGSSSQQLGAAIMLHMLLTADATIEKYFSDIYRLVESLVGPSNSMDYRQLGLLLNEVFKLKDYNSINNEGSLEALQSKITQTTLGDKKYNNGNFRTFSFFGLKFTIDSWAQSKFITNDREGNQIFWNGEKVKRHSTSASEVAFSVFNNDHTTQLLQERITDSNPQNKFRDGLVYHPYLEAARETINHLPEEAWSTSIYMLWLSALRKLSAPADERFPDVFRTKEYSMKNVSTQLASWAQLRHDNMLYVEQIRRRVAACDYPDAFVEPYVEFWEAMESLCVATVKVLAPLENFFKSEQAVSEARRYEHRINDSYKRIAKLTRDKERYKERAARLKSEEPRKKETEEEEEEEELEPEDELDQQIKYCQEDIEMVLQFLAEEVAKHKVPQLKSQIKGDPINAWIAKNYYPSELEWEACFNRMAKTMRMLRDISQAELAQQPLDINQQNFLKSTVEYMTFTSGAPKWTGWYPLLYYKNDDIEDPDLLVSDTFTNPPAEDGTNDPGCVVHQGVSFPRRMTIAVNSGTDVRAYAGPVFDYYEFELPGTERWDNEIWKTKVKAGELPAAPSWTKAYIVSGKN